MKLFVGLLMGATCAFSNANADEKPVTAPVQQTLALVKPEAVEAGKVGQIIARFEGGGLKVVGLRMMRLTKRKANRFYSEHKDRPFYPALVSYMTSGPIVAMVLEGPAAVEKARQIEGATDPKKAAAGTIRADFGKDIQMNAVHGSDSAESAKREISFFFKQSEIFTNNQGVPPVKR